MSMEKRREPRGNKERETLRDSSFRRLDFKPLQETIEVEKEDLKTEEIVEELSEIEKDVLDIAKEILKLKRYDTEFEIISESQIQKYPIIEKLYAKCIAKLSYRKGYSKEEIFLSIRGLEEKNWIVTNERRTKLEILTNEKLVSILEFIKENPGVHARDEKIETHVGITRTPFLKHVMTLERFDLIRSKKIGKTLHYFLAVFRRLRSFNFLIWYKIVPEYISKFSPIFETFISSSLNISSKSLGIKGFRKITLNLS
ncbi:hypothetical protein ES703_92449 [subsurface metagenome]